MSRLAAILLAAFGMCTDVRAATHDGARAWIACDAAHARLDVHYGWPVDARRWEPAADFVVAFEDLLEVLHEDAGAWIVGAHAVDATCRLPRDTLTLHLEPAYVTENMNARCGAAIGGELGIARGERKLVDTLRFEDPDCARLEDYVVRVTVRAGAKEPEIERIPHD